MRTVIGKRARTPAAHKAALVLLGALAALALLEAGMRLAGWALALQAGGRRQLAARPGSFVVLCLGESTTAPSYGLQDHSWPLQLQRILDEQLPGKVAVVNAGLPSTNTNEILARAPELLARHRPSAVIAMMGVNDPQWYGSAWAEAAKTSWWRRLRVGKAAAYVYHELRGDAAVAAAPSRSAAPNLLRLAALLKVSGVPLIAMQYARADAGLLREVLAPFPETIFVDNKPAFDAALETARYEDLFIDRFAAMDWGHCTARGDRIIAENAARAVRGLIEGRPPETPATAAPGPAVVALPEQPGQGRTLEEREEALLAALRAAPDKAAAAAVIARRAALYLRAGRPDRARRDFQWLVDLEPGRLDARLALADPRLSGRAAAAHLAEAERLIERLPAAEREAGRRGLAEARGRFSGAPPDPAAVRGAAAALDYARRLLAQGRPQEARAEVGRSLVLLPTRPALDLLDELAQDALVELPEGLLAAALASAPGAPEAAEILTRRAAHYLRAGRLEAAGEDLAWALELAPGDLRALAAAERRKAAGYLSLGDQARARPHLRRAAELDGTDQAAAILREVLALDPTDQAASALLASGAEVREAVQAAHEAAAALHGGRGAGDPRLGRLCGLVAGLPGAETLLAGTSLERPCLPQRARALRGRGLLGAAARLEAQYR